MDKHFFSLQQETLARFHLARVYTVLKTKWVWLNQNPLLIIHLPFICKSIRILMPLIVNIRITKRC